MEARISVGDTQNLAANSSSATPVEDSAQIRRSSRMDSLGVLVGETITSPVFPVLVLAGLVSGEEDIVPVPVPVPVGDASGKGTG